MAIILFSLGVEAASQAENRMNLLNKLDMLDALEFQEAIDSANKCIANRNFYCAEQNINKAKKLAASKNQFKEISYSNDNLYTEQNQLRKEQRLAEQLRVARKERERARKK